MTNIIKCTFCGKGRDQVDKMVVGPVRNGETIYQCNECIDISHDAVHKAEEADPTKPVYTPSEIKAHLDEYVIGQDQAKRAISVAVYNHYKRILNKDITTSEIDKSNMLMIGPSGSGKTLIVKTIAKMFDIPYVIADATSLTEAGYVGQDVDSLLDQLLTRASGSVEKAEKGIVFIDEVDKLSRKSENSSTTKDISGEGVQQSLLKLVEGTTVTLQGGKKIDTTNILFVASGAFVGLDKITSKSSFGVVKPNTNAEQSDVTTESLIKFGIIPEFVGRFPAVIQLSELDKASIIRIITEPKNNVISQFRELFKLDNVDVDFTDDYIEYVADEVLKKKTGARGIRSVFEHTLQDTQFELPELFADGIVKVTVSSGGIKHQKQRKKKRVNKDE